MEAEQQKKAAPFIACHHLLLGQDCAANEALLVSFRARNEQALAQLQEIFAAFYAEGIKDCFPIENFAALLESGADLALFASGDIDIYGGRADHAAVHGVMTRLGYERLQGNDRWGYFYKKAGAPVEINILWQWQSKKRGSFHTLFDTRPLKTSRSVQGIGLLPKDVLLYMCLLHASVHRFACSPGSKLYFDIGLLATEEEVWQKVYAYAKADGYLVRVQTAARIAEKILEVPVPAFFYENNKKGKRAVEKLLAFVCRPEGGLKEKLSRPAVFYVEFLCR